MESIANWEVKYDLFMDVSSLEPVVIEAKLGDIMGFQIIQIAAQKASFQLTIIALAIEIVPT
jgi:predicted regulator of amino acid metabolism with ACT domain